MKRSTKKSAAGAALLTTALLALTGCASGDAATGNGAPAGAENEQGVFEFTVPTHVGAEGGLEVRIPEALIAAAGSDLDGLLVTAAKITPREIDSAKYCAMDIELTLASGAADSLSQPTVTQADIDQQNAENAEAVDQAEQQYGEGSEEATYAEEAGPQEQYTAVPPLEAALGYLELAGGDARGLDEFDPAAVDSKDSFLSEDFTKATVVEECAASPSDDSVDATLVFPMTDEDGKVVEFASVQLTSMKSGTINVIESDVRGFEVDTQGNWIAD